RAIGSVQHSRRAGTANLGNRSLHRLVERGGAEVGRGFGVHGVVLDRAVQTTRAGVGSADGVSDSSASTRLSRLAPHLAETPEPLALSPVASFQRAASKAPSHLATAMVAR